MPMWALRLVLILLGIVFIAGVYFYTRRHPPRSRKETPSQRMEPTMRLEASQRSATTTRVSQSTRSAAAPRSESLQPGREATVNKPVPDASGSQNPGGADKGAAEAEKAPVAREEVVFSLALRLSGEGVPAERLAHQLQRLGLVLDERHIYHQPDPEGESVFSVANLFEPGVLYPLPPGSMLQGLSFFFMAEPSPATGSRFDRMLGTAYECARALGGQLEDMNHRPLTAARELELKLAAVGARSD